MEPRATLTKDELTEWSLTRKHPHSQLSCRDTTAAAQHPCKKLKPSPFVSSSDSQDVQHQKKEATSDGSSIPIPTVSNVHTDHSTGILHSFHFHPIDSSDEDSDKDGMELFTSSTDNYRMNAQEQMSPTVLGKAWALAEILSDLHRQFSTKGNIPGFVNLVPLDQLIEKLEVFLEKQQEFRLTGKPSDVDVGYHYTRAANLPTIQKSGLLTRQERLQQEIVAIFNGSMYGDGVYTGSDPGEFFGKKYGPIGLMVLRTKGRVGTIRHAASNDTTVDCLGPQCRVVVLKQSTQCLPIFQFDTSKLNRYDANCDAIRILYDLHQAVQDAVDSIIHDKVNQSQNDSASSMTRPSTPISHLFVETRFLAPPGRLGRIRYTAPYRKLPLKGAYTPILPYNNGFDCCVCRQPLGSRSKFTVRMKACGHLIHLECFKTQCQVCSLDVEKAVPIGNMPSGTMTVILDSLRPCPGHSFGSIHIRYSFPDGIQRSFHPNPGVPYPSTVRHAYLPNNLEGRMLLSRLQEAFRCGFSFAVGTSLTTGKPNQVTWALPHKSILQGGPPYGYPDPLYISSCNIALDELGLKVARRNDHILCTKEQIDRGSMF